MLWATLLLLFVLARGACFSNDRTVESLMQSLTHLEDVCTQGRGSDVVVFRYDCQQGHLYYRPL